MMVCTTYYTTTKLTIQLTFVLQAICDSVQATLAGVQMKEVERASKVAGVIWQWVDTTLKSMLGTMQAAQPGPI